jgi:hypothetical protein
MSGFMESVGTGGRLLLLSHTLLPGDRFSYSMTFHPD